MEYYYKKRAEGKTKHQTIVCIMRRIVNILFFMLKNDKEYMSPLELEQKSIIAFQERQRQEQERQERKQNQRSRRTG